MLSIVALTAHVDEDVKKDAIEAGIKEVLEKPITQGKVRYITTTHYF